MDVSSVRPVGRPSWQVHGVHSAARGRQKTLYTARMRRRYSCVNNNKVMLEERTSIRLDEEVIAGGLSAKSLIRMKETKAGIRIPLGLSLCMLLFRQMVLTNVLLG